MEISYTGGYTAAEIEEIILVVKRNISSVRDLYTSTLFLLNTTTDVKIAMIALRMSLDDIEASLELLANQRADYMKKLVILTDTYKVHIINIFNYL